DNLINLSKFSDLCSAFTKCQKLEKLILDVQHNNLEDIGGLEIASAILDLKNLSSLTVQFGYCSQLDNLSFFEQDFGTAQKNQQANTSELNLQNQKLGQNDITKLCQALALCKNVSNLKLKLKKNKIGNEGILGLVQFLSNLKKLSILSFNFEFNRKKLEYKGQESILSQILTKCAEVKQLKLKLEFNLIGPSDVIGLGHTFQKCTKLSTLAIKLEQNKMTKEGIFKSISTLTKCNHLKQLKIFLGYLAIKDQEIQALCPILEDLNGIQSLLLDL
ncbi:hypothetical protein ABPG73_022680, partial [Tetrahymena malaccensis]